MPEQAHPAASMVTPQLDAYPRLCGLPVTIERVDARHARVKRPVGRSLTAFIVAAALVLAGASVARADAPAPTTQIHARAAAIIPPRIIPRVLPRPLRTPRAVRVAARINTSWGKVKTYTATHADEIHDAAEHLSDAIELALDLYQNSQGNTCAPAIEPLCTPYRIAHNASRPAFGMLLIGPYAGRAIDITCWTTSSGRLFYYTPTLGKYFFAPYVWTPWYPSVVPVLDHC